MMASPQRIERTGWMLAPLFIGAAAAVGGKSSAIAAASGALIVLISFRLLIWVVHALTGAPNGSKLLAGFAAIGHLLITGAFLWYLVVKIAIEPLAFLLGLSCIVTAILAEGVRKE